MFPIKAHSPTVFDSKRAKPEHPLSHYLFPQDANPQRQISKDPTENPMARTAAGSRSGMDEYELHGHLSEQLFRAIGGYFENFYSSLGRISEKIYSREAACLPYTL